MISTLTFFRKVERAAFPPAEAREILGVGMTGFNKLVQSGAIRIVRIGGRPRVLASDLSAELDKRDTTANRPAA